MLTEVLTRLREGRRRLDEAAWNLLSAADLMPTGKTVGMSDKELLAVFATFIRRLGQLRVAARWPHKNAKAIVVEVDEINARFMVAMAKWASGREGPPRLGPILGERLSTFVFPKRLQARARVNDALKAEGFPALEVNDPGTKHNADAASPPQSSGGK